MKNEASKAVLKAMREKMEEALTEFPKKQLDVQASKRAENRW